MDENILAFVFDVDPPHPSIFFGLFMSFNGNVPNDV